MRTVRAEGSGARRAAALSEAVAEQTVLKEEVRALSPRIRPREPGAGFRRSNADRAAGEEFTITLVKIHNRKPLQCHTPLA